jgi:hypothetical protein
MTMVIAMTMIMIMAITWPHASAVKPVPSWPIWPPPTPTALDGDGDLDIFAANFGPNGVWLNGAPGLPTAVFDVDRNLNDGGDNVTYWATGGDATLPILLSQPALQPLEVHVQITTATGVTLDLIPFAAGEQIKFLPPPCCGRPLSPWTTGRRL